MTAVGRFHDPELRRSTMTRPGPPETAGPTLLRTKKFVRTGRCVHAPYSNTPRCPLDYVEVACDAGVLTYARAVPGSSSNASG